MQEIYRVFQKELYNFDGGGTVKKESKKEVETVANSYPR
jgi:hypothetical protein